MVQYTVYIDESGDLGVNKGTRWFVLCAVVVKKEDEPHIRLQIDKIRKRLNIREIHFTKVRDFYKRGYIVRELASESFTYMSVLVDTHKFDSKKIPSSIVAYNYICKYLLQRVSWYLEANDGIGDIVLSARGTSRDGELIQYIQEKLLPYPNNSINEQVFGKVCAKQASSWDLLQLADVCASTMFVAYQENEYGFCTPCFTYVLSNHLFRKNDQVTSYGIKFFTSDMKPDKGYVKGKCVCEMNKQEERTPGTTTT